MITMILAAAAVAAANPVCVKLTEELKNHEQAWSNSHAFDDELVAAYRGMYERYQSPKNLKSWLEAQARVNESNVKDAEKADRIVTILLANKCKAPDHVPSWSTYPPRP